MQAMHRRCVLGLLGVLLCLQSPAEAMTPARSMAALVLAQTPGAAPSLPARAVPAVLESTRAKVLAALARGDVAGAIAAYEVHVGRRAPEWLRALQTAYSAKSQEVGRCQEVARLIHTAYSKLGQTPEFIAIRADERRQYMSFDMPDGTVRSITKNGYHAVVKVGDIIYDAFTGPLGMKSADYLTRLKAPNGITPSVVSSP